ncbi:putative DNA-binding domain-containing protein [Neisseriaceae bacterium TC5R-5]|nr:putative DNA-binding domain-containing protein [Neisseriaceae bacterium TC5R-5]
MLWSDWQDELLELIADPQRAPAAALELSPAGLAAYRNNYRLALMETLAFIYPVCRQLVGSDFFQGLAREYVKTHASQNGNLHLYGAHFADFIASFPHTQPLPYLPDCARLEWAVHRCYYAEDHEAIDSSALAAIPQAQWATLQCTPLPGVWVYRSPWPIVSIWQGHQQQPPQLDIALNQAEAVLVYRQGGQVELESLPHCLASYLEQLFSQSTLEAALETALAINADFDLQAALLKLFQQPLLANIH